MPSFKNFILVLLSVVTFVHSDLIVFDDTLKNFQDWTGGWSTVNKQVTSPKYAGTYSMGITMPAWGGFYLAGGSVDMTTYWALQFMIHGGTTGGQDITLTFNPQSSPTSSVLSIPSFIVSGQTSIPTSWVQVIIPFRNAYGPVATGTVTEFWIQSNVGNALGTFYMDNVTFLSGPAPSPSPPPSPPPVTGSTINVNVDITQNVRAINPWVYGVNFAKDTQRGGNAETAYNWQNGVSNRAWDWYFLNVGDDLSGAATSLPEGTELTQFVDTNFARNTTTLLTASTIGYAALDIPNNNRGLQRWSYSVAKYGAQADFLNDAGNGITTQGTYITWNNRSDTYKTVNAQYVQQLMQFLISRGTPVKYWSLDNEVDLWQSTHFDKWGTTGITYNQMWTMTSTYAAAIKQIDPSVKIFGPVSYGYCGWYYSPSEWCYTGPDKQNNGGGLDFLVWYAKKVCDYKAQTGTLLVDYLDVHFYPESISDTIAPALTSFDDPTNRGYRFRSLKGLYDPNYVQESWIGTAEHHILQFIPYLRNLTSTMCPDMKIAITEYHWGNDDIVSGAVATAEAIAIFGREGVDIATRWIVPEVGTYGEQAFKMFLNYDGQGGSVANGGYSVKATSSNVDLIGSYAIHVPSSNKLFVYLFNKYIYNNASTAVKITLNNVIPVGDAQLYRFDSYRFLGNIGSATISNLQFTVNTPFTSATLAVISLLPSGASPSSSPTPGVSASRTPSASPPASSPSSSKTPSPSKSPSKSPSRTPSRSPSPVSPTPTMSPGSSVSPTSSVTPTATATPTSSTTPSASITPTISPSIPASPSSEPSTSLEPSPSPEDGKNKDNKSASTGTLIIAVCVSVVGVGLLTGTAVGMFVVWRRNRKSFHTGTTMNTM